MAHDSILNLTEESFETVTKNSDVPVLVDFWAEWCGPCKMLAPVLDDLAEDVGDTAKICKLDVAEHRDLAMKLGITNIPAIKFYKGGEEVDQMLGVTSKDALAAKLKEIA